jgi:hypothetical protein
MSVTRKERSGQTAPTAVVAVAVLVVASASLGGVVGTVDAQTSPTVRVGGGTVEVGETTRVPIRLSEAPDGLAGYRLTVEVADPSVAAITAAAIPEEFGLTNASVGSDAAVLQASDTGRNVQPGATDIRLGTITLRGDAEGATSLAVSVEQVDADDGSRIVPTIREGRLTVEAGRPTNEPPRADAGNTLTVAAGDTVELDATGSNDPDGDALTYEWRQSGGPSVGLSDAETATPRFTAPNVSGGTTLTFEVTVTDAAGASASDEVTVAVAPGGRQLRMRLGESDMITASADSRVEVPIVVDRAPDGLARVEDVKVSVRDTSVATIDASTPLNNSTTAFPSSRTEVNGLEAGHVNYTASALSNASAPEPGTDVLVGTVVLTTKTSGKTRVVLDARTGFDRSSLSPDAEARRNATVGFRTIGTTLTVGTAFPGRENPPTDAQPSRPGLEDFDGDGRFTFLDVVEVLLTLGEIPADDRAKVNAVDYDDNGRFTFLDTVALLFRL